MNTKEISVFIAIGIVIYFIDINTAPKNYYCNCKDNIKAHAILLIHHIIVIYVHFGWLSNNKYILYFYLITFIFLIIHWKTNNNKCILTNIINDECGLEKEVVFRDLTYFIGVKNSNWSNYILIYWLVMGWGIAYIKLFHTNLFTK